MIGLDAIGIERSRTVTPAVRKPCVVISLRCALQVEAGLSGAPGSWERPDREKAVYRLIA